MSCAAGRAVLRVIDAEHLQRNAQATGAYLKAALAALQARHPIIGDVRGSGFMIGVELVTDQAAKTPATDAAARVLEKLKDLGVLLGKGGLHGNVLRIAPPMCFTRADAEVLVQALEVAVSDP